GGRELEGVRGAVGERGADGVEKGSEDGGVVRAGNPSVDDPEEAGGRRVDDLVADAGREAAQLEPAGEPARPPAVDGCDGGVRADRARPDAEPGGEVLVGRLLALPGELVPARSHALEVLEGASNLDCRSCGHAVTASPGRSGSRPGRRGSSGR